MRTPDTNTTLGDRLVGRLGLAIVVVSLIAVAVSALWVAREGRRSLERRADAFVANFARVLEKPLWDLDADGITAVGNAFQNGESVVSLLCRGEAGDTLYAFQAPSKPGTLHRRAEVLHDGRRIGDIEVTFSETRYREDVWRIVRSTALLVGLILIILFTTTGILVRQQLRLPLRQLSGIVEAYGNGNYSREAREIAFREFQPFEAVLLQMGERIRDHLQELRTLNAALAQKNDQLFASREELVQNHRKLDFALESGGMGTWVYYPETETMVFSEQSARLLGYRDGEMGSDPESVLQLIHPEDRARALDRFTTYTEGQTGPNESEHRLRTKSGEWLWVQSRWRIGERDASGRPLWITGVMTDITQRRETEAREREMQQSLQRAKTMSELGALVAGVAHEVRNPLFGITSTLDAFEARFAGDSERARYLRVLREETDRLSRVMRDLLEYGRPREPRLAPMALRPVVEEVGRACLPLTDATGVTIENRVPEFLASVLGDQELVYSAVKNIVENAVHHAPRGTNVVVDATEVREDGVRWVRCDVRDSGEGFRTEDLAKIFEPFFYRRRGGTGLGLAIVRRIFDEHHGRVVAANTAEGGALVSFWLRVPEA